jgi:co-chaperonin GroES (HSP10)
MSRSNNFLGASTMLDADGNPRRDLGPGELPIQPLGERVAYRQNPPDEVTEGGIIIADIAQHKPFAGVLIAAGLQALEKLHDMGVQLGDEVWWGKFAGVMEHWDHIVELGKTTHAGPHSWSRIAAARHATHSFRCETCQAIRWIEPIVIGNVDDIMGSVQLAERLRAGTMIVKRGKEAGTGRTTFFVERSE